VQSSTVLCVNGRFNIGRHTIFQIYDWPACLNLQNPLQIYHEFVNPPNFFLLIYIALGQKQGALDNFLLTIYKKMKQEFKWVNNTYKPFKNTTHLHDLFN